MTEKASELISASCLPIQHLQDLLSWEKSQISWNIHVEAKAHRADYAYKGSLENDIRYVKSSCPRTLLCHDMKGGYLEDRFVHGTSDAVNPYIFTHWAHVDSFVYFSHQFVTIPPVGWINAAHLHGVQILGEYSCMAGHERIYEILCRHCLIDRDPVREIELLSCKSER